MTDWLANWLVQPEYSTLLLPTIVGESRSTLFLSLFGSITTTKSTRTRSRKKGRELYSLRADSFESLRHQSLKDSRGKARLFSFLVSEVIEAAERLEVLSPFILKTSHSWEGSCTGRPEKKGLTHLQFKLFFFLSLAHRLQYKFARFGSVLSSVSWG